MACDHKHWLTSWGISQYLHTILGSHKALSFNRFHVKLIQASTNYDLEAAKLKLLMYRRCHSATSSDKNPCLAWHFCAFTTRLWLRRSVLESVVSSKRTAVTAFLLHTEHLRPCFCFLKKMALINDTLQRQRNRVVLLVFTHWLTLSGRGQSHSPLLSSSSSLHLCSGQQNMVYEPWELTMRKTDLTWKQEGLHGESLWPCHSKHVKLVPRQVWQKVSSSPGPRATWSCTWALPYVVTISAHQTPPRTLCCSYLAGPYTKFKDRSRDLILRVDKKRILTTSMIGQRLLLNPTSKVAPPGTLTVFNNHAVTHSGYINKHMFNTYYVRDTARKYTEAYRRRNKPLKTSNFK